MSTFKGSYSGVGEVLSMPSMVAEMARRAEAAKAVAIASAPERTGEYKSKFETDSGVRTGKSRRAFGTLRNADDKSIILEYGTDDTPRFRTLGKALRAAK